MKAANENKGSLSFFTDKRKNAAVRYAGITTSHITGEIVARMWTYMPDGTRKYFIASRERILDRLSQTFGYQRDQWSLALATLDHTHAMRGVRDIAIGGI